jgi:hypothetical protein
VYLAGVTANPDGGWVTQQARSLASQLQAVTGQRIVIHDGKAVIVEPDAA